MLIYSQTPRRRDWGFRATNDESQGLFTARAQMETKEQFPPANRLNVKYAVKVGTADLRYKA